MHTVPHILLYGCILRAFSVYNPVRLDSAEFVENITQVSEELRIPDDEDLNGAAMALIRLQDTYRLNTAGKARRTVAGGGGYLSGGRGIMKGSLL